MCGPTFQLEHLSFRLDLDLPISPSCSRVSSALLHVSEDWNADDDRRCDDEQYWTQDVAIFETTR
jgi:hypothetical protein